jgi:GST-like protein
MSKKKNKNKKSKKSKKAKKGKVAEYSLPKVWKWNSENGGKFANINRPVSGPTHDKDLPVGKHPLQLYSLATPNGVKVTIMLEELLAAGHEGAEYDAWLIRIGEGDQFGSGFVEVNPNSKIPALMDRSIEPGVPVFESGAILLYLAEKFGAFLPSEHVARTRCLSWLFWQMGSAPYLGGGFGHFYTYAPTKIEYCIDRFTMETKRQLDVLDKHLADNKYVAGDEYTIADMAIWPWYGGVMLNRVYQAAKFLEADGYGHLMAWAKKIDEREAVKRGAKVNRVWGDENAQMPERHDAGDFDRISAG